MSDKLCLMGVGGFGNSFIAGLEVFSDITKKNGDTLCDERSKRL